MDSSRRRFLRYAVGAGTALGLGGFPLTAGARERSGTAVSRSGSGNPLRIPPVFTGGTLTAEVIGHNVWPDITTELWTLGGSWPAPTIKVRRGEMFAARLVNRLPEPTIVHWHGLLVPHDMDGHPSSVIGTMEAFDYAFTVNQRAGTYWYHPHPHHRTGLQVYKGMAGLFIVEDEEEQGLGLPSGQYDIPLVIQDRRVKNARDFTYELFGMDHEAGFLGDTLFVNGTPDPYLEVERGLYRLRILNGSNARNLYVGFEDERPFHVIGTDGGLLDKPYEVQAVSLATAERVEALVDFSKDSIGSSVMLKSIQTGGNGGYPPPQGAELPIMRFDVARESTTSFSMPGKLATLDRLDPAESAYGRVFELTTIHGMSVDGHRINELPYAIDRIDQQIPIGRLETWTFWNRSAEPHPMHVHGAQFQVLDRGSSTDLVPSELGWKDTVLALPYQKLRVLVRFTDHKGIYLVHCHNLEHEDHGMMSNIEIVESVTAVEADDRASTRLDLR